MVSRPVLELDRVSFGYGSAPVLHDVSVRVEPAEFVAVVGPNGSGKTTLVRLALGLATPTVGAVRLFGVESPRFRQWHLLGYVPQRAGAATPLPLSVDEVIHSGLAGQLSPLRRMNQAQRQRIDHVVDVMGLTGLRRRSVAELSGGQQQRALIARALATAPRLLFLDEPTTGVDVDAKAALRTALEHLVEVEGIAVVYISHDPEGFAGLAHRIIEVRDGAVTTEPPSGDVTTAVADPSSTWGPRQA
jgi:zinc transport system ATP-binding protein